MEPQLPNPNFAQESTPSEPKKPELMPGSPPSGLEVKPSQPVEELKSAETQERSQTSASSAASLASTLPIVIPTAAPTDDTTQTLGQVATVIAGNDDVMGKEWVDKSKEIVRKTKGDPYRKEHEVSKLQADYLYKTFGKKMRVPDDI